MSKARLFACAALAALALASPAKAQTPPENVVGPQQPFGFDRGRNESVANRVRPDFDPIGLRFGGIVVRPSLTAEAERDSNIFYQSANEQDDVVLYLRPRLLAETDWSRHRLYAEIGADDLKYQDKDSEDRTDVFARGEGRLDIVRGAYLTIGGRQERLTERRGAPDSPDAAAKPGRFEVRAAYLSGVHEINRMRVSLRLDRENLNYKDVPLLGGGVVDQDQRDHSTTTATGRFEYALSPDTAIVLQAAANQREYELHPPRSDFDRDSEGAAYLIGFNTDLTNLIRGELIVGWLYQDYDDPALETAKGAALEANIDYFATPITTIGLRASRRVEETLTLLASSYVATDAELRIDHELRRNIVLSAGVGGLKRDFQGMTRDDEVLHADAGARILLNRRMELGARWRYERQDSSGPQADPDYDVNRFALSATLRF
jgi:hypothetical protein